MKRIVCIMVVGVIMLLSGITVAYYNTKTIGFDDSAQLISRDDEKITFLDFELYYDDINSALDNTRKYIPEFINV